ncbi:MAG: hypothetical protein FJ344_03780 [Sphingomonadales bacterium]|nr:hypothetical protein [Sphingomonadales bacterium]
MAAVFFLTFAFLLLGFTGMGIRLLILRNGQFRGTCSSHNPLIAEKGVDCAGCPHRYETHCPAGKRGITH